MKSRDPRVAVITQPTFATFLSKRPLALVHVDWSHSLDFHSSVLDYFDAKYPGKIAYGLLDRSSTPIAAWWNEHFGRVMGTVSSTVLDVKVGFYLFHDGKVVRRAEGKAAKSSEDLVVNLAFALVSPRGSLESSRRDNANALVQEIEPAIGPLLLPKGPSSQRPVSSPDEDPFSVLHVSPSCTSEELKEAYKQQIALNHPDKVDHLAPEFRELAETRIKAITRAYEAAQKKNGIS